MIDKYSLKEMQRLEDMDIAKHDPFSDSYVDRTGFDDLECGDEDEMYPQVVETVYGGYVAIRSFSGHFSGEDPTLDDILQARESWFMGTAKTESLTSFTSLSRLIARTLKYHDQLVKDGLDEAIMDPDLSQVLGENPLDALDVQRRLKSDGGAEAMK